MILKPLRFGWQRPKPKAKSLSVAGHCSLRFGPVTHFLRLWANDAKNSLLLIDPFFEKASILASATALISPTRLSMRVIHCPIDTRLSPTSAKALLNELQPNHLIIPKQYSSSIMTTPLGDSLKTSSAFQPLEILSLPLKRPFEKATLSRELALYLRPKELNDKVSSEASIQSYSNRSIQEKYGGQYLI